MAKTPIKKAIQPQQPTQALAKSNRSSKSEIDERREKVMKLRLRGLGYRAIAERLGVTHMTIKRDIEAVREWNRTRVNTFDRQNHIGESLSLFQEVEQRAWDDYHEANPGSNQRQKFLSTIQDARMNQTKLLADLGVIERTPQVSHLHVTSEVLNHWSPEAQDLVALAILKSQLKPLPEPSRDPNAVIDVSVDSEPPKAVERAAEAAE